MGIAEFAADNPPEGLITARRWFQDHPQAVADVRTGRAMFPPLSYGQLRSYLTAEYGYPFRDSKSVQKAEL